MTICDKYTENVRHSTTEELERLLRIKQQKCETIFPIYRYCAEFLLKETGELQLIEEELEKRGRSKEPNFKTVSI